MLKLRSENGKHIVSNDGWEHTFDKLVDAWEYIFLVRFIRKKVG